jgi:hypothetical protein
MESVDAKSKKALEDIEATHFRRTGTCNPQTIFARLRVDIREACRARARVIHPIITSKIEKLKKRLNDTANNPSLSEEDRILESIVVQI